MVKYRIECVDPVVSIENLKLSPQCDMEQLANIKMVIDD